MAHPTLTKTQTHFLTEAIGLDGNRRLYLPTNSCYKDHLFSQKA